MSTVEIKDVWSNHFRRGVQLASRTVRRLVLPAGMVETIEECRRLLDALEVARALIQKHHDCSKQVVLGQMCPHCCRDDGTSPELDQIWDALSRKNVRGQGTRHLVAGTLDPIVGHFVDK